MFGHPPPNYTELPEDDKGWLGIAKAVLLPKSEYSKVIDNANHIKKMDEEWKKLKL